MADKPKWSDDYYAMVDDCEDRDRMLSAWDVDFLASIREQLDGNNLLTAKQVAKLEEVWEKATRKG